MENVTIRPARLEDARGLAELLRATGWFTRMEAEKPDDTAARVLAHLRQCLNDNSHLVLVAAGATGSILGYLAVHWLPYLFLPGPEGYVSELFVTPEARGQGIGEHLLAEGVTAARARGCCRLQLVNGKQRESYRRGFYLQNGWQERDQMANFVFDLG